MSTYTIEIHGRGVLAFTAETRDEAGAFPDQDWLQADLGTLEYGGEPLWDGVSELYVRDAFPEEASALQIQAAKDGVDPEAESYFIYLLPVVDPTDDAGEED